jgi:hypothetical protein
MLSVKQIGTITGSVLLAGALWMVVMYVVANGV